MNNKVEKYVEKNFSKMNNNVYVTYDDSIILSLAKKIEIDSELLSAKKQNEDFFTFQLYKGIYDLSGVYIFYFGKSQDSGFLCFYVPNLVANKTNIQSFLDPVLIHNINFNREEILNYIIVNVLQELSSFPNCTPHVVRTPNQIWFEIDIKVSTKN